MSAQATVQAPVYERLRLTIPAREALRKAGNDTEPDDDASLDSYTWRVTLRRPPAGLVMVLVGRLNQSHGLRMVNEPEYPGEWPDGQGIGVYERAQWVPCPTCGASLVWYEAGYVPGYRICSGKSMHHVQLSDDGRSAQSIAGRRGLSL